MKRTLLLLFSWLMFACSAPATTSLEWARTARAMLGTGTWSQVVRIENTALHSSFPRRVDALVFEEAGVLWFYTSTAGTQSLSLHRNRAREEKADLSPLFQAIDPGFTRFEVMRDDEPEKNLAKKRALPNGCFIESVVALRERLIRGERIQRARLLSCYAQTAEGRRGHTVLTYSTPRGFYLLDPAWSEFPRALPSAWSEQPEMIAGLVLQGGKILKTRWIPLEVPAATLVADNHRPAIAGEKVVR